jgi:hypothetical protein
MLKCIVFFFFYFGLFCDLTAVCNLTATLVDQRVAF